MTVNQKQQEKIGLFGGTFDPFHSGHLLLADWILNELKLDKVIFIPNRLHPFHKRTDIAPAKHRLKMLMLVFEKFPHFSVCDFELRQQGISYTVNTLRYFARENPSALHYYFIGDDNVKDFFSWKNPREIMQLAKIVVLKRQKQPHSRPQIADMLYVHNPIIPISSTKIRILIRQGKRFSDLLPEEVYNYIREHNLYGSA